MDQFSTGLVIIVLAGVLLAFAFLILRAVPKIQPVSQPAVTSKLSLDIPSNTDAVLLVQPGGRVVYTNQLAKEWFGYLEEEPNLERLARRTRPSETFLGLCAADGQARFSLDGRLIDGASYTVPYESGNAIMVTLRRPQVTSIASGESQISEQALSIFAELSRAMASSLDLNTTLQAILESVERLIPSDFPEITVWDADNQQLIPYRFVGLAGVDRRLEMAPERYKPGEGYSGYMIVQREPLLISNVDTYRVVRPVIDRKQYPFSAYLGMPLLLVGELIGTLELASLTKNAFTENDLEILRILSGQAAVAVHNALLYQGEQSRIRELSGLAKLAHAAGALRDPQDLFMRLVEGIAPLLDVAVLGFLVYDEGKRNLQARAPFIGLPQQTIEDQFIELTNFHIPADSPAEAIWLAQENIVTTNAVDDERLKTLGLNHLAIATGITNAALVPLRSGGRSLGYLHAGDKQDGSAFSQDDLRLLEIVAGQVANIIENSFLVKQTQERAQRSEALRRIASLTGSSATLDEILEFSLRELARLLRADVAAILMLDENRGELRLHMESLYGIRGDGIGKLGRIPVSDPQYRQTVTGSKRPYFNGNAAEDTEILPAYRTIIQAFSIQSVLSVPMLVRGQGIGEVILGNRAVDHFDRSDMSLVSTTASQLAGAIEKSSLYTQTDESLRRRVEQLIALTRVSRELNTTLDLSQILQLMYDELLRTTQASCGAIMLFDFTHRDDVAEPKVILSIGDAAGASLSELEKFVLKTDDPLIVDDFARTDEGQTNPVGQPPHAGIRSAMIIPIAYQEHIAGLIHLHARQPACFDKTSVEIAQTLAIQAAVALGNTHRYQEQIQRTELLNRRVETMSKLLESSQSLHVDLPLEQTLEAIAYGIQESTPFNVVLISAYDPETGNLIRKAGAGLPLEAMEELRSHPQPWSSIQQIARPEFRFSNSYYVPINQLPVIPPDLHMVTLLPLTNSAPRDGFAWDPQDLLLVPLLTASGEPVGLISVDAPRNGLRPDRPTIDSLEIFASQAILALESHLRLKELTGQVSDYQQEIERAQKAIQEARSNLPLLLHKDLEQTIAIQSLSQRARRMRAGLNIAEIVNRQPNRLNALLALGQEMLSRLEMDIALVAEPSAGGPRLLHILGPIPSQANPEALLGQRNPLRLCLQNGEMIQVSNLEDNADWRTAPLLQTLEAKAFICLPIVTEAAERSGSSAIVVDAAVLAISRAPLPQASIEDEQVLTLLARQVAITLENLNLLTETSRRLQEVNLLLEFSRQLGSLDTASILNTLVESAMQVLPAAHAGMVALWKSEPGWLAPQVALGYMDNRRILEINYRSGEALPGNVYEQGKAVRLAEVDFARHYNLPPENLLRYRDATEGRLPVSTMVVPIQTLENKLGVMVLDNFKSPGAFSADDEALITSLAQQTALALENARLYQASEQRAVQLQTLTDLAATITSRLQTDDLIATLLDQLKVIIPYETGTLWLRQGNRLTIRAARGFEDAEERVGLTVVVEDSLLLKEMLEAGRPISVPDVRQDVRFPSLVEPRFMSWLGVPLLSKGEVVGVIALEKVETKFYTPEHIQSARTFAGQAAVALENANLFEESARRAEELDSRSQRLSLLNRLSTELSGSLDPVFILNIASRELSGAVNCTAVSALLFEGEKPVVQVEMPRTTADIPRILPDAPLFQHLRETQGIFSTEDVHRETILAPLLGYLDSRPTQALLVLPLATGANLLGLLFAHAETAYRFTADEVELARTIGNQVGVAVQNARLFAETQRLYAETQQRSAELVTLYDMGVGISQVLERRKLIDLALQNALSLLPANSAALVLVESSGELEADLIDRGERMGPLILQRSGRSFSEYVINTERPLVMKDVQSDQENLPAPGYTVGDPTHAWLGVPLVVRGATIGALSVQSDLADVFGEPQLQLLSQIASQLAIALDNARLFAQAQSYTADLEKRVVERAEQLAKEHKRTQTLLGIITELSTSLDMDLVLNRTLHVINDTLDAEQSLIMLVNPDGATLFLRASLGYTVPIPKGGQVSSLKPNEGLAGWAIMNRRPSLVPDLWDDPRWVRREDMTSLHRSAIVVPLLIGEDVLGVLMLFHRQSNHFNPDQLELCQATAKQIAVALNNAQLFSLIRDQAERLGDMLRTQHVETSRSQAILEAVADGVLVTDADSRITLFNASAEQILDLKRDQVLGEPLESFLGLFGKAAQSWVQTIRAWSSDPAAYQPGDTYAEQIELDNRRVVAVHLSPVRLRNDFLGTVSIFRDITHQVEVDRLKSEFVATVSHELRTPMTSIKGYVEILLMGAAGKLSEQQVHFLDIVKTNTERLAVLVNDLLDISRIEAGRVTLSFQPLDLREIAEDAIANLTRRMQEENRPMQIETDIPSDLPRAVGDPERARQIIDNLLENAYQYTPEGGRISLKMHRIGDEVQVDVKDNGIGILPEEQPRVFERFYRGEDPLVLATSGTGLGLSIVQYLVNMHKGRIWLESDGVPGAGSVFSFTLPAYD